MFIGFAFQRFSFRLLGCSVIAFLHRSLLLVPPFISLTFYPTAAWVNVQMKDCPGEDENSRWAACWKEIEIKIEEKKILFLFGASRGRFVEIATRDNVGI